MQRTPHKQRLDELLVARGLAETRAQARGLILAGQVLIRDQVVDKPGRLMARDASLEVRAGERYVSRGGFKLEAALDAFQLQIEGWICADLGASTGGFTDCLLQHGAARVYAIDVGHGQLAWRLRQDPRVVVMERANVRYLASLPEPVKLATVDVSFIGLGLVLPRVAGLLASEGQVVALIKPQFEAGRALVGKGGVVRDSAIHRAVMVRVLNEAAATGLAPSGVVRSPVIGPAGNIEFLAWLRAGSPSPSPEALAGWIQSALL
jgi:23S rRNA (cytidine1920-2'-O)/16S rRNA (cytidine1409-2'-O)-methyltransferase